jgi:hypothetical protein
MLVIQFDFLQFNAAAMNQRFFKLNLWLERKLSFPGCTDKQLQGNIIQPALTWAMYGFKTYVYVLAYTAFDALFEITPNSY